MHIHTRNVNTSFQTFVSMLHTGEYQSEDGAAGRLVGMKLPVVRRPSRNGDVVMIDEPVTVTYSHPRERVLLNSARDANPFFHVYHSLWMLAGRDDVAPLAYYVKNMANYSDDGKTLNGAYGYRWRHADGYGSQDENDDVDQLSVLVNHLKADPTSRRAVLQMWNVEDDLLKIGPTKSRREHVGGIPAHDIELPPSKDVCCNLSVMFSLRDEPDGNTTATGPERFLDMTVTNRSNDLVWGMLGEDYCTFTFLQEYAAAHLGVEVGRYNHFTNNLHVYENNWKPEEWLERETGEAQRQYHADVHHVPLVKDPVAFDKELVDFVQLNGDGTKAVVRPRDWSEPFLATVAQPMMNVIHARKRDESPDRWVGEIAADDWRVATETWLMSPNRRKRA